MDALHELNISQLIELANNAGLNATELAIAYSENSTAFVENVPNLTSLTPNILAYVHSISSAWPSFLAYAFLLMICLIFIYIFITSSLAAIMIYVSTQKNKIQSENIRVV